MRKNLVHQPGVPETRNDFIDMVRNKKEVILLTNSLIEDIRKDVNSNLKEEKNGNHITDIGLSAGALGIIFASNPIGWIIGGGLLAAFGLSKADSNEFKRYDIYTGRDKEGKEILSFIRNTRVDFKYDTINYPDWVSIIEKKIHKIK